MRAARIVSLTALLAVGFVLPAAAGNNVPGVYPASVGVAPGLLPPEFTPPGLPSLGPNVYHGAITVVQNLDGTYSAEFDGTSPEGLRLKASGLFRSDWPGFNLGPLVVNSTQLQDAIVNIGVEWLLDGTVNGVGAVDGQTQRFLAKFKEGAEVLFIKVLPPPGVFR